MSGIEVTYRLGGRVACLTLCGPEKLHLLGRTLLAALPEAIARASSKSDVDVLVLRGEGKTFSAGADLVEIATMEPAEAASFAALGQAATRALADAPVPVLAVIDGPCLGGGLELALACDIRVATPSAVFGYPAAERGLIPAFGGTSRAPAILGLARAAELAYTARRLSADEALAWGLLADVGRDEDVTALEELWVRRLTERSLPGASRRLKAAFISPGDETEQEVFRQCVADPSVRFAAQTFLGRRR